MFNIGFGSEKRESRIREIAKEDLSVGVILAAVHFEWMMKRAILKLGTSPTAQLRMELEDVSRIVSQKRRDGYQQTGFDTIWKREVDARINQRSALGTVLGKLTDIRDKAMKARGHIVHGNGTVTKASAEEAIDLYLNAGEKLRQFSSNHGVDLDSRLRARIKSRPKQ